MNSYSIKVPVWIHLLFRKKIHFPQFLSKIVEWSVSICGKYFEGIFFSRWIRYFCGIRMNSSTIWKKNPFFYFPQFPSWKLWNDVFCVNLWKIFFAKVDEFILSQGMLRTQELIFKTSEQKNKVVKIEWGLSEGLFAWLQVETRVGPIWKNFDFEHQI